MRRVLRTLRNAFFSRGRRLFGLRFSRDYLRFAWRAFRHGGSVDPGSLQICGFRIDYWNQSHALFLLHEIFVNAEYSFHTPVARPRIVDCGANIGMSVLFFKAVYPDADVLAFEPNAVSFAQLTRTIEANALVSVVAEQAAVTERGDTATLYRDESDPASIVASVDRAWGGSSGQAVRAVRLSDYITTPVDFLKLDVEGSEHGVVRDLVTTGAIEWIRETVIEYHPLDAVPSSLAEMTDALGAAGFDVRVQPSPSGSSTKLIRARRAGAA